MTFLCEADSHNEATEAARVLLKMVDLECEVYSSTKVISLYIQPYQAWVGGKGWCDRAMSVRRYKSIKGLNKGISEIIKRKTDDPSYLSLPTPPDPHSKRFVLNRKGKVGGSVCRLVGSQ